FRSTLSISIGTPIQCVNEIWRSAQAGMQLLKNTTKENAVVQADPDQPNDEPADQSVAAASSSSEPEKSHNAPFIVQQAKQFIRENYHRSITLKEVAGEMFVTPGHLSWLFRESGESYLQYLTSLRMNK